MAEQTEQLTDIQRFKKILEYFVAHLTYVFWREDSKIEPILSADTQYKEIESQIETAKGYGEKASGKKIRDLKTAKSKRREELIKANNLEYPTPDSDLVGWKVICEQVESDALTISGQAYKESQIMDCMKKYTGDPFFSIGTGSKQTIGISVQLGMNRTKTCYLHWFDDNHVDNNINVNPKWDNEDKPKKIIALEIGQGAGSAYTLPSTETYKVDDLGLFDGDDANEKVKMMFKNFVEFRLFELSGSFLTGSCADLLKKCYNLILSGAPGTGKTWLAKDIASTIIFGKSFGLLDDAEKITFEEQCKLVQFHPSYDYTDFVEGLRPKKQGAKGFLSFERQDGSFKLFCARALAVWNGVNGTSDEERLKKAFEEGKIYVFIIDEINRGELSKIFGELFFALDKGYRGESGKVQTQYQNIVEQEAGASFKGGFFVPKNVYIIGTMNDIDRSVEPMDFAMRRRFSFKEIKAEDRVCMLGKMTPELRETALTALRAINNSIVTDLNLSPAYQIGPSCFLDLSEDKYDGDFNKLWNYHIEGMLREYLRSRKDSENLIGKVRNIYQKTTEIQSD